MVRVLLGILALAASCLPAVAGERFAATDEERPSSMRFEWHGEGPSEACGESCHRWISAAGVITNDTALDFEVFARNNKVQGATLVLDSSGGSVTASLALGRAIRRFDMTTTVGKTIPAKDGTARARLSPNASCESMCAFLLLSGTRRYVPPQARVLVHMIWLGDKRDHAREENYTADDLSLVQRDIGKIARYTVEMGGSIELMETALRIPPWKPLYALAADEVYRMGLINTNLERLFDEDSTLVAAEDITRDAAPESLNANGLGAVITASGG